MESSGLLDQLEHLLVTELPAVSFQRRPGPDGPELAFQSPSIEVGEITVSSDGDELTVGLGTFTHIHWGNGNQDHVARNTFAFLKDVFEDKVEFFGEGFSGGLRPVGQKPRGWLSRLILGSTTYRWSGPVSG